MLGEHACFHMGSTQLAEYALFQRNARLSLRIERGRLMRLPSSQSWQTNLSQLIDRQIGLPVIVRLIVLLIDCRENDLQ